MLNHIRTHDTRTATDGTRQHRYRCSCGAVGSEWYTDDKTGIGWDHMRKAWAVHANYARAANEIQRAR